MKIQELEPQKVFTYFEELSRIPRGSGNTKAVSDYCVEFARKRGLRVIQDEVNNIMIFKPGTAGYEDSEPVILQGHLDMVCEKTANSNHDFEKDPLELYIEDGYIKAKNTTLGADDGIAVAFCLALLDSDDIAHPPLEAVFTIDEETGMDGADALDMSKLQGKILLNMDSEDEGILTVGCAGGFIYEMTQQIKREEREGELIRISLSGLQGGHSGIEIHKQYGNADKMAGRLLNKMRQACDFALVSVDGGKKDNVIVYSCSMDLLAAPEDVAGIEKMVKTMEAEWKREFGKAEPNLQISVQNMGLQKAQAICDEDADRIIFYLNACPNGVYEYSRSLAGMVETSCNLGVVETKEEMIVYRTLVRSAVASKLVEMKERLQQWTRMLAGADALRCTGKVFGEYPAWMYKEDSRIREIAIHCYQELYGKDPEVMTIHAGLECGLLSDKREDLDCISFGPQMYDVHSVKERLDIASTQRTWEYVKAILKACK